MIQNPRVCLVGAAIHFKGMTLRPAPGVLAALERAAKHLTWSKGALTCATFSSAAAARKVFEAAFNVDAEWEALTEAVPDDTRWEDQAGMKGLVAAALREGK